MERTIGRGDPSTIAGKTKVNRSRIKVVRRCMEIHRADLPYPVLAIIKLIMHATRNFIGVATIMESTIMMLRSRITLSIMHALNRIHIQSTTCSSTPS